MRILRRALMLALPMVIAGTLFTFHEPKAAAATPPAKKMILVIGQTKGFEHDSVPDAMATLWTLGHDTGLWKAYLRTDTELITKGKVGPNGKNLNQFDALVFASTTGELDLTDQQKTDMMSFIHDDGKGFVGIHAALDTNYKWPEYGEMIGGWFDQHPWFTFDAPIINEQPDFPAVRHFPKEFTKRDEIYQPKDWSRDKVNVLLRLDERKLDFNNPRVHRTDKDFAVAWAKMYGKGRVFYSTLGHTESSWDDPDIQKMYFEAVKWVTGMTEGSTKSHPKPAF
jgi:type 1 glutamine amidotransferase